MGIRRVIKEFEKGNVCVVGEKGSGKDLLMSNVVVRRNKPYVSNIIYDERNHIDFIPKNYDCGENTFRNFLNNTVNKYIYPHEDGTDIYVSDSGVYFPSQYNSELDRQFAYFPTFCALIRHMGDASIHCNAQAIGRIWLKIREQCHRFITCKWSVVLFKKIVIQEIIIYNREQSCADDIPPFSIKIPLFAKREVRQNAEIEFERYKQKFGRVERQLLIYIHKSKYDTRRFKHILENGNCIKTLYNNKGEVVKKAL